MPLREYQADKPGRCPLCKDPFIQNQKADDADLTECPRCGAPIHRIKETVNSPKIHRPLSNREIKETGFTVLQKNKHGLYEKQ